MAVTTCTAPSPKLLQTAGTGLRLLTCSPCDCLVIRAPCPFTTATRVRACRRKCAANCVAPMQSVDALRRARLEAGSLTEGRHSTLCSRCCLLRVRAAAMRAHMIPCPRPSCHPVTHAVPGTPPRHTQEVSSSMPCFSALIVCPSDGVRVRAGGNVGASLFLAKILVDNNPNDEEEKQNRHKLLARNVMSMM